MPLMIPCVAVCDGGGPAGSGCEHLIPATVIREALPIGRRLVPVLLEETTVFGLAAGFAAAGLTGIGLGDASATAIDRGWKVQPDGSILCPDCAARGPGKT